MDPSAKFNTKVYVFHVKEVGDKDWDAADLIYGLCREDKRFSHTRFKNLCRINGRYFFSKCVNTKDSNNKYSALVTWDDIKNTLKDWKPVGSPTIQLVESPTTFTQIALLAYERKIFNDEKARIEYLGDVDTNSEVTRETSHNIDSTDIVAKAIMQSESLSREE